MAAEMQDIGFYPPSKRLLSAWWRADLGRALEGQDEGHEDGAPFSRILWS
jgi:hypothetical protein